MHPETLGIDSYVKVDYRLRGCPIEKTEFLSLLKGLLAGKVPQEVNHPVCMECNNREIECLMLKGIPCMGPVACAGCNALCPSAGAACEGCRGIMKDAGIKQLKDRMKEIGLDDIMIKNMLERFSANEIRAIESGGKDA
jgi:coenzyme F420-reducing hydrogenase gamma subunit